MKFVFVFIAALIMNGLFYILFPNVDWLVRGLIVGVLLSLVVGVMT